MSVPQPQPWQEKAEATLRAFAEEGEGKTAFPHLPKDRFVTALRQHLHAPHTIQQGRNGTCGAATLLKHLAETRPDLYAEAAIALYTSGQYAGKELRLAVTEAMRGGTEQLLRQAGINAVDAIFQGALANAANLFLPYNPFQDKEGLRSFMWPWFVRRWAKRFLGIPVAGSRFLPSVRLLQEIDYERYFVLAIVCKAAGDTLRVGLFPNHYVQILGIRGRRLRCWSWGERHAYEVDLPRLPRFVFQVYLLEK